MLRLRRPGSSTHRERMAGRQITAGLVALGLLAAACSSSGGGELSSSAVPGTGPLATSSTTAPGGDASGEPDSGSSGSVGGDAGAPAVEFDVDPVEWQPCGAGDCADLEVPLDHAEPTGDTITVAMSRLPATGSADQRVGSIFVNFGGLYPLSHTHGRECAGGFANVPLDRM